MASNLHKVPANFNLKRRSHPFKVFVNRTGPSSFKCSIEPNSIVYDFFNDKEVKIEGITNTYPIQAGNYVILVLNYTQKGTIITNASIKVTSSEPAQPQEVPCFPDDQYYSIDSKCVSQTESTIATIEEEDGAKIYTLKALQKIYHHITKYACFTNPSEI